MKNMLGAQRLVEDFRKNFESQVFTRTTGEVSVSIRGDLEVVRVTSNENVAADVFFSAYQAALHVVKYARSIELVKIRNKLISTKKLDITSLIPEVQEAIDYLNSSEKPSSIDHD